MNVYAVRDLKAESFLLPFFMTSHGLATRMVLDALREGGTPLSQYPQDFSLYHIGSWDTVKGVLTHLAQPSLLAHVAELVSQVPSSAAPKADFNYQEVPPQGGRPIPVPGNRGTVIPRKARRARKSAFKKKRA